MIEMSILKDTESEQLRQLVKACLLEISKLKIELKKCQNEYKASIKQERSHLVKKNQYIKDLQRLLDKKETELINLNGIIKERDVQLEECKKMKFYFDALTAKPKKDLTSFQSQVYQLMDTDKSTVEDHYQRITNIFTELSLDNFSSILRNLERKGYVKSSKEGSKLIWKKIEK